MAIRGENIGTAYVRILADGSGLNKSIRDQFDDVDFDKYGKNASREWIEGFEEEQKSAPNQRIIRDALAGPMVRGKWLRDTFFKSQNWREFRKGLRDRYGDAGEEAANRYERGLLEGMDLGELTKRIQNVIPDVLRVQKEFDAQRKKMVDAAHAEALRDLADFHAEGLRLNKQYDRARMENFQATIDNQETDYRLHLQNLRLQDEERNRQYAAMLDEAHRMNVEFNRRWQADLDNAEAEYRVHINELMREDRRMSESQRRQSTDMRTLMTKLREDFILIGYDASRLLSGRTSKGLSDVRRNIAELGEAMKANNIDNRVWVHTLQDTDRELARLNPRFRTFNAGVDRVADGMGRAFGRGARNDFVNMIGSMVRGLFRVPRLLSGLAESLTSFAGIGRLLGGLGIGVAGAFAFVGPLISLFSLAAGAVTALASSLTFALVGAAGAAAGAMLPLVAGIGVAVLAFQNMDKETKQVFKSIGEEFKGLGEVAADTLFADAADQAERFRGVIGNLTPVVRGVADALSDVASYWLGLLETPGFDAFRADMEDFLPGAVRSLGKSLGDAFGGFGGILRGLLPLTSRFLGWLEGVTKTFNEWANSQAGQRSLLAFFEDAGDSARDVGRFLGSIVDLIGEIMSAGQESGGGLFRSMTDTIEGWTRTLERNPEMLRDWFSDAEDFARSIGRIIQSVGRLLDVLDNAFSRGIATGAIRTLGAALETLTAPLRLIARLSGQSEDSVMGMVGAMAGSALVLRGFGTRMGAARTGLSGFVGGLRNAETRAGRLGGALRGGALIGGLAAVTSNTENATTAMGAMQTVGGAALLGFAAGGPIGAAIGATAGTIKFVADAGRDAGDAFSEARPKLANFASTMDRVTGATTAATRALALQKLERTDTIDQAKQFGLSARDVVSASLGEHDAIRRVNTALKDQPDLLKSLTAGNILRRLGTLTDEFDRGRQRIDDSNDAVMSWKEALRGVPKKIATKVENFGMDLTLRELRGLNKQYDLTPKEIRTIVKATDLDLTRDQTRALVKELTGLDKKEAKPKVDLEDKDFQRKHKGAVFDVEQLADLKPSPKADLLLDPFNAAKRLADAAIKDLDGKRPQPRADLDTGAFANAMGNIMGDLNVFDGRNVNASANVNVNRGELDRLIGDMGNLDTSKVITITTEHISTFSGRVPKTATGGIFAGAQPRLIGEAGPEAVVPLSRSLSQVDPAVRALSAFAQGKLDGMARGGVVGGGGRTVNVEQHIYSPQTDPKAVAAETVNRLVAVGY